MFKRFMRNTLLPLSSLLLLAVSTTSQATIVELQMSYGNTQVSVQVNLFDETTPKTVENFLAYENDGAYTGAMIHRSMPGFVLQGGGFTFDGAEFQSIATMAAVVNEPVYSNLRGTIAMAKLSDDENSATNQWFFNLANNSANLDVQNGGFTVFGQVVEGDMEKIDTLAAIQTCDAGAPFDNLPLVDFDCSTSEVSDIATENLLIINQVVIIDSSAATAANLTPVENTLINNQSTSDSQNDSGGSIGWMLALLVSLITIRKLKVS